MARYIVCSVYDSKVKYFSPPMLYKNRGEALRGWEEAVNDVKSTIAKYPADFTIMEIGEWNDDDGAYVAHAVHQNLGNALQYKRSESV